MNDVITVGRREGVPFGRLRGSNAIEWISTIISPAGVPEAQSGWAATLLTLQNHRGFDRSEPAALWKCDEVRVRSGIESRVL